MKRIAFLLFTLFPLVIFSQNKTTAFDLVDAKMQEIPRDFCQTTTGISNYIAANFSEEKDRIRAAFFWTANNIYYDVANMLQQNPNETAQEKIDFALQNKKGVCMHYVEVFKSILTNMGFSPYIIQGHTKQNNRLDALSHVWCVLKIKNEWFAMDPTWAAGSVNNGIFVKKTNNRWYKVPMQKIILSHMPFDYLWQLQKFPITTTEFTNSYEIKKATSKPYDFETELSNYNTLSEAEQIKASLQRIEENGINNSLLLGFLEYKKKSLLLLEERKRIEKYAEIVTLFNEAVANLNDFVRYRNQLFKPEIPDNEILWRIENPKQKLVKCQELLDDLGDIGQHNQKIRADFEEKLEKTLKDASMHYQFVLEYNSKPKLFRKTMFYKKK